MLVTDRPQLVGLETEDGRVVLEEGAQITRDSAPAVGTHAVGHVTSAYHSAVLGRSIALAVIEGGRAHLGETFHVPMPSGVIRVKVVSPAFYDPKGGRLHG
jgi:sarcosine oxidase subunit alpha